MSIRKRNKMPEITKVQSLKPFAKMPSVTLYQGNALDVLKKLPTRSVHCCISSPPYWGLRDYGTNSDLESGSEETPEEFVATMVKVFREVKRVLRFDGTLFLNLGDTYAAGNSYSEGMTKEIWDETHKDNYTSAFKDRMERNTGKDIKVNTGLKQGNLVGIPWRVALALQADGWILRQDIIWQKVNPMPESVQNRCTKSHEYIFLLTQYPDYYFDAEAIREKAVEGNDLGILRGKSQNGPMADGNKVSCHAPSINQRIEQGIDSREGNPSGTRNKRDVWSIASQGYPGAHFATFPPKLIEPCILAGTSEYGCCSLCGSPYERLIEEAKRKTIGWKPTCGCRDAEVIPCTVLDPFIGSGTTCCVSLQHGRHSIGIDLSAKYLRENAIPRITETIQNLPHAKKKNLPQLSTGIELKPKKIL